jgi:hypothetical protein
MPSIDGTVIKGRGWASDCVKQQLPYLVKFFPEISDCYQATINVALDAELEVTSPDCTTPPFTWNADGPQTFAFLGIRFEVLRTGTTVAAWTYIPSHAVHKGTPKHAEVLAEKRLELTLRDACRIHLPPDRSSVIV